MWSATVPLITMVLLTLRLAEGIPAADPDLVGIPDIGDLREAFRREAKHFSTMDLCSDAICDQMVRQANGLARIKMIRKYIVNSVSMMDKLVTALDAELVVAGELLTRSLGNRCRAAHAVLGDVIKGPVESDRLNGRSSAFVYGQNILNRAG